MDSRCCETAAMPPEACEAIPGGALARAIIQETPQIFSPRYFQAIL
jgi:hypothetical protein